MDRFGLLPNVPIELGEEVWYTVIGSGVAGAVLREGPGLDSALCGIADKEWRCRVAVMMEIDGRKVHAARI